jgi:flagellar biosynthesis/type III secretory pathway protein FliH
MAEALTVHLPKPVAGLRVVEEPGRALSPEARPRDVEAEPEGLIAAPADEHRESDALRQQKKNLAQLCETVNSLAARLNDLHQQTVARHRTDIARLAVEIARKILTRKIDQGEYDIQTIIEEALKRAPTRQNLVVRVNPEDLAACQQLQQENVGTQFAELDLVADWSIARANCLVETPKGIVKSFIEEHLARIGEALEKA